MALGNRSAALYHLGHHTSALADITLALENKFPRLIIIVTTTIIIIMIMIIKAPGVQATSESGPVRAEAGSV